MLTDEIIDFITGNIANQLRAHDGDLEEELKADEGKVTVRVAITLVKLGGNGDMTGKIKTTIPRAAEVDEVLLPNFKQRALPGME